MMTKDLLFRVSGFTHRGAYTGYALAWGRPGPMAYFFAGVLNNLVADRPTMGRIFGSTMFAAAASIS